MSLVRFQNVSVRFGERVLLREIFFRLQKGDRVGLIGANGTGKSTLLKLILGQEAPSDGKVDLAPGVRIGYFSQFSELEGDLSVQQVLEGLFADVRAMEADLEALGSRIAAAEGAELEGLLYRQAHLLDEIERRDGWSYPTRIDTVLGKLGFSPLDRERPVGQLSGGWRNRASLAKIVIEEPDLLLLDEPTNYLDVDGIAWLEEWLGRARGAFLLVSHDRHFLDRVVNRIVELENYHLHEYAGGYADYVREKPFRLKTLARQFQHEEELLLYEAEAIAERQEAARDPRGALRRKLADLKKRAEPRPVDTIVTDIYRSLRVPEKLLRAEGLAKAYDGCTLFQEVSFELHQQERLAILGPNGCGKTTLLRLLTGQESPDAGRRVWESGVVPVFFNQVIEELPLNDTVSHAVNVTGIAFHAPRKQVHRFLALLRFSEMDLTQRIGTLSGGERARVALARCLLAGAAVLLLDEPTNHLDVTSIQVMERALVHFPGAVLFVSHDRFFIDKVATRLLVLEGGRAREVNGNWTTWQATRRLPEESR